MGSQAWLAGSPPSEPLVNHGYTTGGAGVVSPATAAAADEQLMTRLAARAAVGGGLVVELVDRRPADGTRARWHGIHLQPVLCSGGLDVVRQWGRVGGRHRPRRLVTPHATEGAARAARLALLRRRLRRGSLPAR